MPILSQALNTVRLVYTVLRSGEPVRIHLQRRPKLEWWKPQRVQALAAPLLDRGFREAGMFIAAEIPGLKMQALIHQPEAVTAVIYELPLAGIGLDLVTRYEDGSSVTFTNMATGSGMPDRPGHPIIRSPGADATMLWAHFLADRPHKSLEIPEPERFPAQFEKAYADTMDWRNSRGGPTAGEIRASVGPKGDRASEQAVQATVASRRAQAVRGLQTGLRERFLEATTLSAEERDRLRPHLVVIHDRWPEDRLLPGVQAGIRGEGGSRETGLLPRQEFESLNERRPQRKRFTLLGELRWPIEALVYADPVADPRLVERLRSFPPVPEEPPSFSD